MFEYVIWDFGGTLFDTYPAAAEVFLRVLEKYEVRVSVKEILEKLKESTSKAARYFVDKYKLHNGFLEDFYSIENHLEPERQPPFEGAQDICIQINKNGGSNFLFSHRSNYSMTKLLNYYNMLDLFSEIVSADSGFARKPDPQAIMYIIDKYGLEREKVITIGDREIDIEAGKRAGIATCLFNPDSASASTKADFVVTSLKQVPSVLQVCNRYSGCES